MRILFTCVGLLQAAEGSGDVYYDFVAGASQGTLTGSQSLDLSGYNLGFGAGYYQSLADALHVNLGLTTSYTSLNYAVDGAKKVGQLNQFGLETSLFLYLVSSFQVQAGAIGWVASDYYVGSYTTEDVNGSEYQSKAYTRYSGPPAYEGYLRLLWEAQGIYGKSSRAKFGFGVSEMQQSFDHKSERVVSARPTGDKTDSTIESSIVSTMTIYRASLILLRTF